MKIPVNVRVFPGSDQERVDLVAAVRRHCACEAAPGGGQVIVIDESCAPHDLLGHDATLKRLVFYRRWHRSRVEAL